MDESRSHHVSRQEQRGKKRKRPAEDSEVPPPASSRTLLCTVSSRSTSSSNVEVDGVISIGNGGLLPRCTQNEERASSEGQALESQSATSSSLRTATEVRRRALEAVRSAQAAARAVEPAIATQVLQSRSVQARAELPPDAETVVAVSSSSSDNPIDAQDINAQSMYLQNMNAQGTSAARSAQDVTFAALRQSELARQLALNVIRSARAAIESLQTLEGSTTVPGHAGEAHVGMSRHDANPSPSRGADFAGAGGAEAGAAEEHAAALRAGAVARRNVVLSRLQAAALARRAAAIDRINANLEGSTVELLDGGPANLDGRASTTVPAQAGESHGEAPRNVVISSHITELRGGTSPQDLEDAGNSQVGPAEERAVAAAANRNTVLTRLQATALANGFSARSGQASMPGIADSSRQNSPRRSRRSHGILDVDGGSLLLELLMNQVLSRRQGLDRETINANSSVMTFCKRESKVSVQDVESSAAAVPQTDLESSAQVKCIICLDDFTTGQSLRILPCFHRYHVECVDKWLATSPSCPVCKHDITSSAAATGDSWLP